MAVAQLDVPRVEEEIVRTHLSSKTREKVLHFVDKLIEREEKADVWYKKPGSLCSIAAGSLLTLYAGGVFLFSPWRSENTFIESITALFSGRVRPSRRDYSDYETSDVNTFVLGASGGFTIAGLTLLACGINNLRKPRSSLVKALSIKTIIELGSKKKTKDVATYEEAPTIHIDDEL